MVAAPTRHGAPLATLRWLPSLAKLGCVTSSTTPAMLAMRRQVITTRVFPPNINMSTRRYSSVQCPAAMVDKGADAAKGGSSDSKKEEPVATPRSPDDGDDSSSEDESKGAAPKLTPGTYQVRVHVIEASGLHSRDSGGSADPVCQVVLGKQKKATQVKNDTLSAVWDQLFIFELNDMESEELNKLKVSLRVEDSNLFKNTQIGMYEFSIRRVYAKKDHEVYRQWVALVDGEGDHEGIQGYLKCSITVLADGDSAAIHDSDDEGGDPSSGDLDSMVMKPPNIVMKKQYIVAGVYEAEGIPRMDLIGGADPFVRVKFGANHGETSVAFRNTSPEFNEELRIPMYLPNMAERIEVSLMDFDAAGKSDVIATRYFDYKQIKKHPLKTQWINFYGAPPKSMSESVASLMNSGDGPACFFRGRVLMDLSVTKSKKKKAGGKKKTGFVRDSKSCENEPETEKYLVRLNALEGTELPSSKKVWLEVCIGGLSQHSRRTRKLAPKHGYVQWYDICGDIEITLPKDYSQIPDVFVYLWTATKFSKKRIGYKRHVATSMGPPSYPTWQQLSDLERGDDEPAGEILYNVSIMPVSKLKDHPQRTLRQPNRQWYVVRAFLYKGRNLPSADLTLSDPFVEVRTAGCVIKSKVVERSTFPSWYEVLEMEVPTHDNLAIAPPIYVVCYDADATGKSVLGRFSIDPLSEFAKPHFQPPKWHPLYLSSPSDPYNQGELLMSFQFVPEHMSSQFPYPETIAPVLENVNVAVDVIGVRGLKPVEDVDNPYVEFDLGDEKLAKKQHFRTDTYDSPTPTNANMRQTVQGVFPVPRDPLFSPVLNIRVFNNKVLRTDTLLGTASLDLKEYLPWILNNEPDKEVGQAVDFSGLQKMDTAELNLLKTGKSGGNIALIPAAEADKPSATDQPEKSGVLSGLKAIKEKAKKSLSKDKDENSTLAQAVPDVTSATEQPSRNKEDGQSDEVTAKAKDKKAKSDTKDKKAKADAKDGGDGEKEKDGATNKEVTIEEGSKKNLLGMAPLPIKKKLSAKASKLEKLRGNMDEFNSDEEEAEDESKLKRGDEGRPVVEGRLEESLADDLPYLSLPIMKGKTRGLSWIEKLKGETLGLKEVGTIKFNIRIWREGEPEPPLSKAMNVMMKKRIKPYVVRVYMLEGITLMPKDGNGFSDPFVQMNYNDAVEVYDKGRRREHTLNPEFFQVYDIDCELPGASKLDISLVDFDSFGDNDLIGTTTIDLEDRIYRPSWREMEENPIEYHALWHPDSRISQGKIKFWVEIRKAGDMVNFPRLPIGPPPPTLWSLRCVIWGTDDLKFTDEEQEKSDLFVRGGLLGMEPQETDIHLRAKKGKGNFNWRMVFPVELPYRGDGKVERFKITVFDKEFLGGSDILIGEVEINMKGFFRHALEEPDKPHTIKKQEVTIRHPDTGTDSRGKVKVELALLPNEIAKNNMVGLGRGAPNKEPFLEAPDRPLPFPPWRIDLMIFHIVKKYKTPALIIIAIIIAVAVFFIFTYIKAYTGIPWPNPNFQEGFVNNSHSPLTTLIIYSPFLGILHLSLCACCVCFTGLQLKRIIKDKLTGQSLTDWHYYVKFNYKQCIRENILCGGLCIFLSVITLFVLIISWAYYMYGSDWEIAALTSVFFFFSSLCFCCVCIARDQGNLCWMDIMDCKDRGWKRATKEERLEKAAMRVARRLNLKLMWDFYQWPIKYTFVGAVISVIVYFIFYSIHSTSLYRIIVWCCYAAILHCCVLQQYISWKRTVLGWMYKLYVWWKVKRGHLTRRQIIKRGKPSFLETGNWFQQYKWLIVTASVWTGLIITVSILVYVEQVLSSYGVGFLWGAFLLVVCLLCFCGCVGSCVAVLLWKEYDIPHKLGRINWVKLGFGAVSKL